MQRVGVALVKVRTPSRPRLFLIPGLWQGQGNLGAGKPSVWGSWVPIHSLGPGFCALKLRWR